MRCPAGDGRGPRPAPSPLEGTPEPLAPARPQPLPRPLPGCAAADAPGGEWPFYSGTLDGHREQLKEKSIDTGNVSELGVAWKTKMPDGGVIHSTPVVVDGCVYTGTDLGNVYALNADTGKVVWTQALGEGGEGSGTFEGAGIVGSPAVAGGLVYVGATTPKASVLSALDQATGKVVWKRVVDEDEGGGLDSSPVPFNGMVFQAFKGDESSNHSKPGFAIVDGSRKGGGKILVKTHNIPAEDFEAGYRGGSIINTPAVDLERKLVFAGTGNPVSQKQHPRTNSLLKIDADPASPTFGKILASHRGTSDSYPSPAGHRLAHVSDGAAVAARPLLVRAVRLQLPGVAEPVDELRRAPDVRRAAEVGGVHRGLHRHHGAGVAGHARDRRASAATSARPRPTTNGIYVAVTGGNLYSLNRDTGAVQWATPLTGSFRYNGLAVANGVVYSLNDATGTLQAFDTSTGAQLFAHPFSQDTGTPMNDMGNSSGVSVARNTVFATSQADGTSTLFALKLGANGGGGARSRRLPGSHRRLRTAAGAVDRGRHRHRPRRDELRVPDADRDDQQGRDGLLHQRRLRKAQRLVDGRPVPQRARQHRRDGDGGRDGEAGAGHVPVLLRAAPGDEGAADSSLIAGAHRFVVGSNTRPRGP